MKTRRMLTILVLALGFRLTGMMAPCAHADPLPAPWNNADVGGPDLAGSASYEPFDESFAVTGDGGDIWGEWDQFHYVYQDRSGDFTITARVVSMDSPDPWSKAGVMIRETLEGNSKHAMMMMTPENGATFQWRLETGGQMDDRTQGGLSAPYWVRLVRKANTFKGYHSPDGVNWTLQAAMSIPDIDMVALAGLAVTSHNFAALCTAQFDNVSIADVQEEPCELVGHWSLDEGEGDTAHDVSGNGNDGTLVGTAAWAAGIDGFALESDGEGYVEIPNESHFDLMDQLTVAAWIKVDELGKNWQAIVTKGDSAWRLHRRDDLNSIAFHCHGLSAGWGADGEREVDDGQWHHVAATYDGETISLYVDGQLDTSLETSGAIWTNDYPVMIGANAERPENNYRSWDGCIDDVRIYNCALSEPDIQGLLAPVQAAQSANIGIGLVTCPGATNPVSSMTDSVGNKVETRCNGAFSLAFIRPGKAPCYVGACGFPVGENVGWVDKDSNGEFTRTTWHNYEGHETAFDPTSKVVDSSGNGMEDRRTYIYDVASNTLTIQHCERGLVQTGPYKGCSDPGLPWKCGAAPGSPFSDYCSTSSFSALSADAGEIDFISNTARVTPIQFVGAVLGGGQVIVSIHDVEVVVPTDEHMEVQGLAHQVVQHFNDRWTQPDVGQQQKSANISPHHGQIVYIYNADEAEVEVRFVGEPRLNFNYYPHPVEVAEQRYPAYEDWVQLGEPECWCWPYQCDGDVDGATETFFNYRVYGEDLAAVVENWKKKIDDPTLNPCADIDHKAESFFNYRVYGKDLAKVVANWKKKDEDLLGDCPMPDFVTFGEDAPPVDYPLQAAEPDAWETAGEWAFVEQDGYPVLGGGDFGEARLEMPLSSDYTLTFSIRLSEQGMLEALLRDTGISAYNLNFGPEGIYLQRNDGLDEPTVLAASWEPLRSNQWHKIDVLDHNGDIRVYVNGSLEIAHVDTDVLEPGVLSFAGHGTYIDVLREAIPDYEDLKGETDIPNQHGFSRFVEYKGIHHLLEYGFKHLDVAVLENSVELAAKGFSVSDMLKIERGTMFCAAPEIVFIGPDKIPLYRGTDPARGKMAIHGRHFLCGPFDPEKLVTVHISNGEIKFKVEAPTTLILTPDGYPSDVFRVEIDLLPHIASFAGQYGEFDVVVEEPTSKMLSRPRKIYILPPWHTESMIVSKVVGLSIEDDGEDRSNRGEPEHLLSFSGGAEVMTPAGTYEPYSTYLTLPDGGYAVFEEQPGNPQEYYPEIPVWHSPEGLTGNMIMHVFSGIEQDNDVLDKIMEAIGTAAGAVIGGFLKGPAGAFAGVEAGGQAAKKFMSMVNDSDNEFFGVHGNQYPQCHHQDSLGVGDHIINPCPYPYGIGKPSATDWKPFHNTEAEGVSAKDIKAKIKTLTMIEQAPLVNSVKVILKSVKATKDNEIDGDVDVYVYYRAVDSGSAYDGAHFREGDHRYGVWEINTGHTEQLDVRLYNVQYDTNKPVPLAYVYVELNFWDEDDNSDDNIGSPWVRMFRPHELLPKDKASHTTSFTAETCGVPDRDVCVEFTIEITVERSLLMSP